MSKKGYKVALIIMFILAIVFPIAYPFATKLDDASDFYIDKYTMDVTIDDYGDMHVVEKVTNEYDELNTVFYKNIIYDKNTTYSNKNDVANLVKDVRVIVEDSSGVVFDTDTSTNSNRRFVGYSYNNDKDELGDYITCTDYASNCEMIFYYDRSGISKTTTFTYEYTIEGVVTKYADISEFNWVLLSYQSMDVNNVEINITLPSGDYDISKLNTYFHGSSSAVRTFTSSNSIKITVDKIDNGEMIETRLLMNNETFSNIRSTNISSNIVKDTIVQYEADQVILSAKLYKIFTYVPIAIFVLALILLAYMWVSCYKKYDKEFTSTFDYEYYRELPNTYGPAVMGYLYKFKEIDENDLTASLLDLIRRKYLILENNKMTVNDDEGDYTIKKNEKMDDSDLAEHEKFLIKWFISDIGDGKQVTSVELKDYCKDYNDAITYYDNNKKWVKLVEKEARQYKFFDKEINKGKKKYRGLNVINFVLAVILISMSAFSGYVIGGSLGLCLLFLAIAFILYTCMFDRRTKSGNEDYVRWKAFKHFLEEFSNFKDYPVPSLIIWEHYLVYATSFGIADKVMKQLKLKFNASDFENGPMAVYYGYHIGFYHHFYGHMHMARMTSNSMYMSRNGGGFGKGGFSSGGFGGGHSFGGGGGSFGGR